MNKDFTELLEGLPHNIIIQDSFTKARSVICTDQFNRIVCSVSGGSDSDLIVDIMTRLERKDIEYVFFDTGLEYKATKDHLNYLEKRYGIEIKRIRAKFPVPLAVKEVGQPFLSKQVSEYIYRLQRWNFQWEDEPYEELVKKYPRCKSALAWWCNYKNDDNVSMFNINRNKWLKEFILENPPTFQVSSRCCELVKKRTSMENDNEETLNIVGIRLSEGGQRAGHKTCITYGHQNIYRPIFWYSQTDKEEYEAFANIQHSACYTEYGLKRTGCAGCPFGRQYEFELEVLQKYEPMLYKAACNIFKESYEYTRKYRAFCRQKEEEKKSERYGNQMSIFDYINEDE